VEVCGGRSVLPVPVSLHLHSGTSGTTVVQYSSIVTRYGSASRGHYSKYDIKGFRNPPVGPLYATYSFSDAVLHRISVDNIDP
jgi:hypothetical protein